MGMHNLLCAQLVGTEEVGLSSTHFKQSGRHFCLDLLFH